MSEHERVVAAIEALPERGEGMTVGDMAERCRTDSGSVVAALETIVEREERAERRAARQPKGER